MATKQIMTAEEFMEVDEPGRCDLIRGELVCMAPAGGQHGRISLSIGSRIYQHVVERGLGEAYGAETGFLLSRDPDVVLAPDVAFIRRDRLPPEDEQVGFVPIAPDLVVEIVSPSDRVSQVNAKITEYRQAGVRLIWVIDPAEQSVTVYYPDRTAQVLVADDLLEGGDVLPGFQLRIAQLFR